MSNLTARDFRTIFYYNFKRGLSTQECFNEMTVVFGENCPSLRTVERWYLEFKRNSFSLDDQPRSGRPTEIATDDTVAAISKAIKQDRHITYRQLEELLHIPVSTLHRLINDNLQVTKLCTLWVPHSLTTENRQHRVKWCQDMLRQFKGGESKDVASIVTGDETWVYYYDVPTKAQSRVWVFEDEDQPVQVRKSKSVGKRMVVVFFGKRGLIKTVVLEKQKTVTAKWYTEICLPALLEALTNLRPNSRLSSWFLHHDNAPAHRAALTTNYIKRSGLKLLNPPPYSPDLAPCDFALFPYIKKHMKGRRFSNDVELLANFEELCSSIPTEQWESWFDEWFVRMKKCINKDGHYFEKI